MRWPARPKALIAELATPLPLPTTELPKPTRKRERSNIAVAAPGTQNPLARFLAWNREDAFAPPAVALLLIGALALFTLANQDFSADSARAYRWIIIEPVLFYFLLTDIVTTRRGLLRVLDFFVGAGVFVALIGLWQFLGVATPLPWKA